MHDDFQILKNLIVQQSLELNLISGLVNSILCLLPELVRDIRLSEALAV